MSGGLDRMVVAAKRSAEERNKRIEEQCPERYIQAFEAMREALREVSDWYENEIPYREDGWQPGDRESWERISKWRAALALADKASKGTR